MSEYAATDVFADLYPARNVLAGGDEKQLSFDIGDKAPDVLERYAAVPSLADPRVLLPLDASGPAMRAVLGQHATGAASTMARGGAKALQLASHLGLISMLLRDRVSVTALGVPMTETPLHTFLAEVLGCNEFVTCFRLAPGRPNGKPVVQAVDPSGVVLAYAKFGWEKLTRHLVRMEAEVLRELVPLTCGMPLQVPRVLYGGRWRGLEALVLAPLSGMGWTPRSMSEVPVAASVALAGLRSRFQERLAESVFWRDIASRIKQIEPLLSPENREILLEVEDLAEALWGDVVFPFGQSHGDWIPPNMSIRSDGTYNVWDWERSRCDAPLGIDTMQFILFLELRRHRPDGSLGPRLERYAREALCQHGLDPSTWLPLAILSLLSTTLWFGEARQAGRSEELDGRFIRALAALID